MSAPCPVLGFIVRVIPLPPDDAGQLLADLRTLLAANDLVTDAAPGARELSVYRAGSQATDADAQVVKNWARQRTHSAAIHVSDLIDLNPAV